MTVVILFLYASLAVALLLFVSARKRAREAYLREGEALRLLEFSRRVLIVQPGAHGRASLIAAICQIFSVEQVAVFDPGEVHTENEDSSTFLTTITRGAYFQNRDDFDPGSNTWLRVLRAGATPTGAIALQGGRINSTIATGVASLVAIALERNRAIEGEARAEAARQGEYLRTAVLDSLAHTFKTPLTTIRAISSGLLAMGSLSAPQTEALSLLDAEAERLNALSTRLLRTARLDSTVLSPSLRAVPLLGLVDATAALLQIPLQDRILDTASLEDLDVQADPDLLTTALVQVLENAAKYSHSGATIRIYGRKEAGKVLMEVSSPSTPIPEAEWERVFERFYRSASAQSVAGSGLGLSIARRIVEAQNGRIWLTGHNGVTTLHFLLPAAETDRHNRRN